MPFSQIHLKRRLRTGKYATKRERRARERRAAIRKSRQRLALDRLEQRLLLNADVLAFDLSTIGNEEQNQDLLVRLYDDTDAASENATTVQRIQIVDSEGGQVLAFGDVSDISAVTITGTDGDDRFTLDTTDFTPTTPLDVSIEGGDGDDTLTFETEADVDWLVDARNAGSASDGLVDLAFSNVESLVGAADNEDTFTVEIDGGLDGGLDGSVGGFDTLILGPGSVDTLVYNATGQFSGEILRDADSLSFDGLEPIQTELEMVNLVVDISPDLPALPIGQTVATLTTGGTFDFELTGPDFEGVQFNTPSNSLKITSVRDLGPLPSIDYNVKLIIDGFTNDGDTADAWDLIVETEEIEVADGVSIGTALDPLRKVTLRAAESANESAPLSLVGLTGIGTVTSAVSVAGDIYASGEAEITSKAERILDATGDFSLLATSALSPLQIPVMDSTAVIAGTATIDVGALKLEASTNVALTIDGSQSVLGSAFNYIDVDSTTRAEVADAASVDVGATNFTGEQAAAIVRATDTTNLSVQLAPDESGLLGGILDDFEVSVSVLTLARNTQALVGNANFGSATSGNLAVEAKHSGKISNKVNASLIGATYLSGTDTLVARIDGGTVRGDALSLLAKNESTYESQSKVAVNSISGATRAILNSADVQVEAVALNADDETTLTASSKDFEGVLDQFPAIDLSIAGASNEMSKMVSAGISGGSVTTSAAGISLTADNSQKLVAKTEALSVSNGTLDDAAVNTYNLSLGGTIAANEMLGDAKASITGGAEVTSAGALKVEALNESVMDSTTDATTRATNGTAAAVGASIAFNLVGYDVTNIFGLALDTLIGSGLGGSADPSMAHAQIDASTAASAALMTVRANNKALMNATVSNAAESTAVGDPLWDADGMGFSMILAANKISSESLAEITNASTAGDITSTGAGAIDPERMTTAGGILVEAIDQSELFSNGKVVSSSITTNDGGASKVDEALGELAKADFRTNGTNVKDANGDTATNTQSVTFGKRIGLTNDYEATGNGKGAAGTVYRYLGTTASMDLADTDFTNLDVWQPVPETELTPTGNNITDSNSLGVGGLIVRNELDANSKAQVVNADLEAAGEIAVVARENATLKALNDIGVTSSGGSSFGTGESMAIGGFLVVNTANAGALASVEQGSDVESTAGAVNIAASNATRLEATNKAAVSSGADAIGVLLAFNTLGYSPTNLLFQTLDALIGTDIGPQSPSDAIARIIDSTVAGEAGVSVEAVNKATLQAMINSDVTAKAAAMQGASGMAAQGVLASNMLAGDAQAYIDETDTTPSAESVTSGSGAVSVKASDKTTLDSKTLLVSGASRTNDLGIGLINNFASQLLDAYQYTTKSGTKTLEFGDKIYVASDYAFGDSDHQKATKGTVYRYLGTGESLNLGTLDFSTATIRDKWNQVDATSIVPAALARIVTSGTKLSGGNAKAYYALISRNEAEGGATAFIDDYDVTAATHVEVVAVENATLSALEGSTISAKEATGGIIATNELNSRARAYITDSDVDATAGNVKVSAQNVAVVDATTVTEMTGASATTISVVIAFNSVGFDGSNLLFQAIDAILGSDYLIQQEPVGAQAYIEGATVDAGGRVDVSADTRQVVGSLSTTTAQALDDMAKSDGDADDTAQDVAFLAALKTELEGMGLELAGSISVETIATQAQWYVSDGAGHTWQIKRNTETEALEVALVNLLDARVSNKVVSSATNDRSLLEGVVASKDPKNKGKAFTELKYGADSGAAGGVLVSNRVASETKAWIAEATPDYSSAESVGELRKGDLVSNGVSTYEYVGANQVRETDFDYSTRGVVAELENGDRIRLHEDHAGFSEGDILEYTGAGGTDVDLQALLDSTPGVFSASPENPELSLDLSNAVQSYASNPDWELRDASLPSGSVTGGTGVSVTARDEANLRSDSTLEASSVAVNNNNAFLELAKQKLATEYDFTTESGNQTVTNGQLVRVASTHGVMTLQEGKVYQYGGTDPLTDDLDTINFATSTSWVDITAQPPVTDLFPNFGNTAESNSKAYGGIIVTNDVRGMASASIRDAIVTADTGDIDVTAKENATLLALLTSSVSSSGGSAWGTGASIAFNGQIATNLVQASAEAIVRNATLEATTGSILVFADNAAILDATVNASTKTGDTGGGLTLSFNTIGWRASNVLFNVVDTILSDPLISEALDGENPSNAVARILNSDTTAGTDVTVKALSSELLNSTAASSVISEASAVTGASGQAINLFLAANKVSGAAYAEIDMVSATGPKDVTAGGDVLVQADDKMRLFSNTKITTESTTTNDGGASVLQETLNDLQEADWAALPPALAGTQFVDIKFGQKVRLDDEYGGGGDGGTVYEFLGTDTLGQNLDLNNTNYSDTDLWKQTAESTIVPTGFNVSASQSKAVGAIIVYNDLRSDVEAKLENTTVTTTDGDISVLANQDSQMKAEIDAAASSSGGAATSDDESQSLTVNVIAATNLMLGGADAAVIDAVLRANDTDNAMDDGNIVIRATNKTQLTATNGALVSTGDQGVSIFLAFNSVGWEPSNLLFNTLDGIIGDPVISSAFNGEAPVDAEAYSLNSTLDADEKITVEALTQANVNSKVTNDTTSAASALEGATGMAVGAIVATNKLSSGARAYIDVANFEEDDGGTHVQRGDRVLDNDGNVYQYDGPDAFVNLSGFDFVASGAWAFVHDTAGMVNDVDAGNGLYVHAKDSNGIFEDTNENGVYDAGTDGAGATNDLKVVTVVSNGPRGAIITAVKGLVGNYDYTTKSGKQKEVSFGKSVFIASDYDASDLMSPGADPVATPGQQYYYAGTASADTEFDFGTIDYANDNDWILVDPAWIDTVDSFIPQSLTNTSESDATAGGGMVALNDTRSRVEAIVNEADVDVTGQVEVLAEEAAVIVAKNSGTVSAEGGSIFKGGSTLAINAMIATNTVLADSLARIADSDVDVTAGGVKVAASTTSILDSDIDMTTVANGGDSAVTVGVSLAFNSIGVASQNFLFNAIDAIFGLLPADEIPSLATAEIVDSDVTASGNIEVDADSKLRLDADILNAALSASYSVQSGSDTKAI